MTDPLRLGAERYGALAILAGRTPPPARDDIPFEAYFRYVDARYPTLPDPDHAGFDVHGDRILAHLGRSARYIRQDWMDPSPYDDDAQARVTLTTLGTLHRECMRHAGIVQRRMTSGICLPERRALQFIEESTLALAFIALVPMAETGDRGAIEALVLAAEERVHAIPSLLPYCVGARAYLSAPEWPVIEWTPEIGVLGILDDCISQGERILNRRAALQDVDEDRAGIVRRAVPTGRKGAHPGPGPAAAEPEASDAAFIDDLKYYGAKAAPGVLVFPEDVLAGAGKSENRSEIKKLLGKSLGARLPLVPVPDDWDAWEQALVAESPWHAPAIRAIRATQHGRSHWGNGVVLLLGGPGAGKSRLARRVGETSGLPFARYNCEASSDNSGLGGTSIRWASAHPGVLEPLLASAGNANGMVLLDEIEKAGGSRQSSGGKPHDLMHGLFERETARAWKSPYLLAEIDVSNVLYVCTANSLTGIPTSLLDRMRVVHVQEPGPEHLGVLLPQVAAEACAELGLDPRWGTFDSVEIEVLAGAWPGGSIRRLQRLVAGLLQARDGAPGPRH